MGLVLAHPERYVYFQQDISCLKKLYAQGLLLQVNLNSLSGYYSKTARDLAEHLIDQEMVAFIGSDCHHQRHLNVFKDSWSHRYVNKLAQLSLRNNTL
ncbi:MAG: CpsB/CapC family capsule biosynthesis tyrosine phosphatase [Bacteroidota bacterium]